MTNCKIFWDGMYMKYMLTHHTV